MRRGKSWNAYPILGNNVIYFQGGGQQIFISEECNPQNVPPAAGE